MTPENTQNEARISTGFALWHLAESPRLNNFNGFPTSPLGPRIFRPSEPIWSRFSIYRVGVCFQMRRRLYEKDESRGESCGPDGPGSLVCGRHRQSFDALLQESGDGVLQEPRDAVLSLQP